MIILVGLMFLMFTAASIIWYVHNNKEEPVADVIEEKEPEVDFSKIEKISGKYYYEDEYFYSSFGIDVSEFQKEIDWKKVSNDSVEFVFIRIGRRGATTGLLYDDERFEYNYKGAKENGIRTGIYFFSQAITEEEAVEEAHWVMDRLKGKQLDFPIVYDCEEVFFDDDEVCRVTTLDKQQTTKNTLAFLNEIKKNGYEGIIYTYSSWANNYYDMEALKDYPIWFAQYDVEKPDFAYPYTIWQYSDKGTINGISKPVDLNIMFIRKSDQPE